MRYLILADIHGNAVALDAVVADAERRGFDRVVVLGDLVGYGAEPNEVIERVRELAADGVAIRGNHDKVAAGIDDGFNFNEVALAAARWTRAALSAANRDYLERLDAGPVTLADGTVVCHGSPVDEDEYLLGLDEAWRAFHENPAALTFFGHTHLPALFAAAGDLIDARPLDGEVGLEPGVRYLINPGSVGQPRDRDWRAAYAIYDASARRLVALRTEYPLAVAQEKIVDAGLPRLLAHRLGLGA